MNLVNKLSPFAAYQFRIAAYNEIGMWDDTNQVILIRMDYIVASHKGVAQYKAIERAFNESNVALVY